MHNYYNYFVKRKLIKGLANGQYNSWTPSVLQHSSFGVWQYNVVFMIDSVSGSTVCILFNAKVDGSWIELETLDILSSRWVRCQVVALVWGGIKASRSPLETWSWSNGTMVWCTSPRSSASTVRGRAAQWFSMTNLRTKLISVRYTVVRFRAGVRTAQCVEHLS